VNLITINGYKIFILGKIPKIVG